MGVRSTAPAPLRRLLRRSWLRHLLLGLGLVLVMLSIVGMHQLSVGHDVATAGRDTHEHAAASGHHGSEAHTHRGAGAGAGAVSEAGRDLSVSHVGGGAAGLAADDCPTCGDHDLALGSCLLALALLVLSWLLLPPRLRRLPPFLRLDRAPALIRPAYERVVPPLSLAELSLRRT